MKSLVHCLGLSYLILSIAGLFAYSVSATKARRLMIAAAVFFMIFWRFVVSLKYSMSSRYYCSILLLAFFFIIYWFHSQIKGRHAITAGFIFLFILTSNIVEAYSSFSNLYIFDAIEFINREHRKDTDASFIIQNKEINRLGYDVSEKALVLSTDYPSREIIQTEIDKYRYWDSGLFMILFEETDNALCNLRRNVSFKTNKHGTKELNFYSIPHESDIDKTIGDMKDNLISNGDMEIIENRKERLSKITKWGNSGAAFYVENNVLLPMCDVLLQTWIAPGENSYPKVFLDSSAPINGTYSLNVLFTEGANNRIAFLQKIKTGQGILKFKIRSYTPDTVLHLTKIDYTENNRPLKREQLFHFFINDNDIHDYSIEFKDSDFSGVKTIFYLDGNNSNIVIDDICYLPVMILE